MPSSLNNATHWRKRAEEARSIAERSVESETREMMIRAAETYDWLAERAEPGRAAGRVGRKS